MAPISMQAAAAPAARFRGTPKTLADMVDSLADCCSLTVLDQYAGLEWADTMLEYAHKLREQHKSRGGRRKAKAASELVEIIKTPARARPKRVLQPKEVEEVPQADATAGIEDKENVAPAQTTGNRRTRAGAGTSESKRKVPPPKAAPKRKKRKSAEAEETEPVPGPVVAETSSAPAQAASPASKSAPSEAFKPQSPQANGPREEKDGEDKDAEETEAADVAEPLAAVTPAPYKQKRALMSATAKSLGAGHGAATPASSSHAPQSFAQRIIAGALGSTGADAVSSSSGAVDAPAPSGMKAAKKGKRKSDEAFEERAAEAPSAPPSKKHAQEAPSAQPAPASRSALETLRSRLDTVSKRTSTAARLTHIQDVPALTTAASKPVHEPPPDKSSTIAEQPSSAARASLLQNVVPETPEKETIAAPIQASARKVVQPPVPAPTKTPSRAVNSASAIAPGTRTTSVAAHPPVGSTTPLDSPKRPVRAAASPNKTGPLKFVPLKTSKLAADASSQAQASAGPATQLSWTYKLKGMLGLGANAAASSAPLAAAAPPAVAPVAAPSKSPKKAQAQQQQPAAPPKAQPQPQQGQDAQSSQMQAPSQNQREAPAAQGVPAKLPSLLKAEALRKQTELDEERRQKEKEARRKQVEANKDQKDSQAKKRLREDALANTTAKVLDKKIKATVPGMSSASSSNAIPRLPTVNRVASGSKVGPANAQPQPSARQPGPAVLSGIAPPPIKRMPTNELVQTLKASASVNAFAAASEAASAAVKASQPSAPFRPSHSAAVVRASQSTVPRPPPASIMKKTPKPAGPPSAQPTTVKVAPAKPIASNFTQHNPFQQQPQHNPFQQQAQHNPFQHQQNHHHTQQQAHQMQQHPKSGLPTPRQKTPVPVAMPSSDSVADEDIALPDVQSEYSMSDDEETQRRRAEAPAWTKGQDLKDALAAQASMDPDEIFGRPRAEVSLPTLFPTSTRARRPRSSSGNWTTDQVKQWEIDAYNYRMGIAQNGTADARQGPSRPS